MDLRLAGVNCSCELLQGKLGELLLSLCYQTNVGAISVEIIEARGLKAMDINGFSGTCGSNVLMVLIKHR